MPGIYGFSKRFTEEGKESFVRPLLGEEEIEHEEWMAADGGLKLTEDQMQMRREGYVSIVSGPKAGRYGILMGARNGQLEVCIRSDYKDDFQLLDINDLRHLPEPPEKNWKTMTAKEAVESLMAKDPKSPTIRALRKEGLLNEILYPDRVRPRQEEGRDDRGSAAGRFEGGREGGKRVRSIAVGESAGPKAWSKPSGAGEPKPKPWSRPASPEPQFQRAYGELGPERERSRSPEPIKTSSFSQLPKADDDLDG